MSSEWEELDFKLEDVTVWFRCDVCKGYLHSIPALREHAVKDHNVAPQNVKLPKNLPPGAEEGKIFFEYVPPRKSRNKGEGNAPSQSDVSGKPNAQGETDASGEVSVQDKVNESPPHNYDIRIRDVSELVEHSSDEDDAQPISNELQVMERDKGDDDSDHSEAQVASPPDSGMFDDTASDGPEDEVNLTLAPPPVPVPSSSNNNKSKSAQISTSTPPPPPTIQKGKEKNLPTYNCSSCSKSYKSQGILNFHVKKAHPPEDQDQGSPPSNSKLILKFTRNANTGTFSTKNILPVNSDDEEEDKSTPRSPPTLTVPSGTESDSDSDEGPTRKRKRPNRRAVRLQSSSSSSSATSKTDSDNDETSDDSSVPPMKSKSKRRRPSRHSHRKRVKSPSPSSVASSSTPNASDSSSVDTRIVESSDEETEEEGELTDKSTTSASEEDDDVGSAPELSDYGDDKDKDADKDKKKLASSSDPDSDDDLFIKVKVSPKKKRSTSLKNLKKHGKRAKTRRTPQQQQQCTTICGKCNMQCKNPNALVQHLREFHKDNSKSVGLLCGYCKKRYTNKRHFNKHINAHIREKELEKKT